MTSASDDFERLASAVASRLASADESRADIRSASAIAIDRLADVVARRLVALTEPAATNQENPDADARRFPRTSQARRGEQLPLETIEI